MKTAIGRLQESNLKLNGAKCTWFSREISLLGHIVNIYGISMDMKKIDAILKMLAPKNVKQVQIFLGLGNYYRRFICEFAKIIKPIATLLQKDVKFLWSEECQIAFDTIKKLLQEYPILRMPDPGKAFIIYTDASGYALGAILAQVDNEQMEYVCMYASRLLKGAELHYGITEKECLAVIWAVRQFRVYVHGARFTIVTDHSALNLLRTHQVNWYVGQYTYNHMRRSCNDNFENMNRGRPHKWSHGNSPIYCLQRRHITSFDATCSNCRNGRWI